MAIAFDGATAGSYTLSTTSHTFSHSVGGGTNNILFVVAFGAQVSGDATGNLITGATYASVAMTEIARVAVTGDRWAYLFFLVNPATGSNNVVISGSTSIDAIGGSAASYSGAAQTGVPDNSATATANSTSAGLTTSITPVLDSCWTLLATKNTTGATSNGTGATVRAGDASGLALADSNGAITPPASNSMTVTNGTVTASWGGVIISFAPVAAAPSSAVSVASFTHLKAGDGISVSEKIL